MIAGKKGIINIISNVNKALAFELVASHLSKEIFDITFILLNPSDSNLEKYLRKNSIAVYRIKYQSKKDIPIAIFKAFLLIKKIKPAIVHCHLFDACIVGLIAAKLAGIKKRIYTRHHSTYHHQYFPKAVKYDRFINSLATDIVAISKNVKKVLIEKEEVPVSKIHTVYHGFDIDRFENVPLENIKSLRFKYAIDAKGPVVGVISRYIELKGIQYIIPAFKRLLKEHSGALLILANATGNYSNKIKKELSELPSSSYLEINFESDLFSLYKVFDVFIHVPISADIEAFGQTYVEALAARVPAIFTLSGIACEFIENGKNAIVVPYKDDEAIYNALKKILSDSMLRKTMTENGFADVHKLFDIENTIKALETLYLS